MHRSAFILFITFTSLIAIAGVGTLYFAKLNRSVQQILQLNNSQLHAMNNIGDNFRFLKQSGTDVGEKAKQKIMGQIIKSADSSMLTQRELEDFSKDVKKYHFWSKLPWADQKLGLSEMEMNSIIWLRGALISDQSSSSLDKSGDPRPTENYTINLKGWRHRILEQNVEISESSAKINNLQFRLIIICFSGLGFIFGLIYFLNLRPMITQFQSNAQNDERLLLLQKEIGVLNSKILNLDIETISRPGNLMASIKSALRKATSLNDIMASFEPMNIPKDHFVIEAPIHNIGSSHRLIYFFVPSSLEVVKNELTSLVKNLSNYIGILSEVNLRLEAETQRDAYHQIVQIALEALPNPIAIFDNAGFPIMLNPSFKTFFQIEDLELKKLSLLVIEPLHDNLIGKAKIPAKSFFDRGNLIQETFTYQNATSSIWTKLPIYETGHMFIAQDITNAKRDLENTEHENRLQELGRISGTVAHDSNNFLSVIMSSLEFFKYESNLSSDHLALVEQAILSCAQASKMNKQLVSYASRQNLAPEPLSIKEIESKAREFFAANDKHNVKFSIIKNTERSVFADRVYLNSAICNIIRNSLETVSNDGKIEVLFSNAPDHQVCITITDDGPGFSDAALIEAKQPFFSEKSFGSGLGLAAVDGFARQSGGSLSLSNARGAKVDLYLPSHNLKAQKLPVELNTLRESSGLISNKTILLLEDNIHLGKLIDKFLSGHGCKIIYYSSVPELTADLSKLPHLDMIITDVILKDTTCFEVIEKLAHLYNDIQIFYITGYGSNEFTKSIRDIPGYVIEKPFSLFELQNSIEKVLVKKSAMIPKNRMEKSLQKPLQEPLV